MGKKKYMENNSRPSGAMYPNPYFDAEQSRQIPIILEHYKCSLSKFIRIVMAREYKRIRRK